MPILNVRHVTTYRYRQPVRFGEHRIMCRPRDSHDQRLLAADLVIDPAPSELLWRFDPFGNEVAVARFEARARELRFENHLRVALRPAGRPDARIEPGAQFWPFSYGAEEMPDLARFIERQYRDPAHAVDRWVRRLLQDHAGGDTALILADMAARIRRDFAYIQRDERGVQDPAETLRLASGTCRDFALLMMEAVRALGMAARFVSGYLHNPRGGASGQHQGAGATHAWMQVYLPGFGWADYDPTNAIADGRDLIRVATVREPAQAVPLAGSYAGLPGDSLGMTVEVRVDEEPETPEGLLVR
ncbi:transglutaminase family protein [Roseomonas elaeocarpi]|uniref:Transglutaminase N-terminal domain-containing protein n=1 Tax=Roseomonas elaeocarpi TaxID=907779 RepID=A0ABV6JTQ8_9PROT